MRYSLKHRIQFGFLVLGLLLLAPPAATAQDYTVNATTSPGGTADANPGDGHCATSDGVCTLRAAIEEANATSGLQEVHFNISRSFPECDTLRSSQGTGCSAARSTV